MIGIIFERLDEVVEIRIDSGNLLFRSTNYGSGFVPIECLHIDQAGAIKDNPDLKDNPEWRTIALERLKSKIMLMSEEETCSYVIDELTKWGYRPVAKQKSGFRVEKFK